MRIARQTLRLARRRRPRAAGAAMTVHQRAFASMADMPGPRTAQEYDDMAAAAGNNQYELYDALHARYGDVMYQSEDQFGVDIVTLFHPRDIEAVIRREGPLPRGLGQALLPFTRFYAQHAPNGLNLGRIDGPDWKRVRKPMAKHMMPPRAAKADSFAKNI